MKKIVLFLIVVLITMVSCSKYEIAGEHMKFINTNSTDTIIVHFYVGGCITIAPLDTINIQDDEGNGKKFSLSAHVDYVKQGIVFNGYDFKVIWVNYLH